MIPNITHCPGTLAGGFNTYSPVCLKRVFRGKKVSHILPYNVPETSLESGVLFEENRKRISVSGIQEKYLLIQEKNKLRLTLEGEQGTHILKPIPGTGKKADQMPANEHLTMQIARQVYGIETAENAMIFFQNGDLAYITRRFDTREDGIRLTTEDFATLAERTPQTHGEHYKYLGNYLDLFLLMQKHLPAYKLEAPKLLKLLIFNYLFSNGDAHFKNFSLLETPMGDYRLSPAYDLLNSRIHIEDSDFALEEGLLPRNLSIGNVRNQFFLLATHAGLEEKQFQATLSLLTSGTDRVAKLIAASWLDESTKRNYLQSWQTRLKRLAQE
ncbi:MAG: HipA domain-containing protein [Bacteroidia bacterium]|nr:HipA domain-containing protein [Bacteroidia bacterium]